MISFRYPLAALAVMAAACGGSVIHGNDDGGTNGVGTGGAPGAGGTVYGTATGGHPATGGWLVTGGSPGTGGALGTVVPPATGGTGGVPGTGGSPGAGGVPGTGGVNVVTGGTGGPYPAYPGFTLVLAEDFDAPLDLTSDPNWTYSDGYTEGNYTRLTKEAITFANGNLVITATNPANGAPAVPSFSEGTENEFPAKVDSMPVQSGELRSKYNNWRYGRFEARMKVPRNVNVIGAFNTFRSPKWQDWRWLEFDLTPANPPTSIATNIVYGNNCGSYGCTQNYYAAQPVPSLANGATMFDDFHRYAIENLPTGVKWYVDGGLIRTVTKFPSEKSMKITFNLWVFPSSGWGGGDPANNTYPMSMLVDWVRLYRSDADTVYPCRPLPACQPADDKDYQKNNAEDGLPAAAPW